MSHQEDLSRGEMTRQEIVTAAHDLFIQNGFHGTSMRQIARRAGIALGGIYNHFPSKEDIFAEVLLTYHPYREILPAMRASEDDDIETFVGNAMSAVIASIESRPDFLNLMLIEIVEFKTQHIPYLYETLFPQFFQLIEPFMQRQKDLRPIPTLMLMRIFIGFFFSFYITEKLLAGSFPPEMNKNALDYFVDVLLHGIVARDAETAQARAERAPDPQFPKSGNKENLP